MVDRVPKPVTAVVRDLSPVDLSERAAMLDGPRSREVHRSHFDRLACMGEIERGGAVPRRTTHEAPLRVVAWNVERLPHVGKFADTLLRLSPDLVLLNEVDKGMARTGNGHQIADLAQRMDASYLYGLEFLELGVGSARERRDLPGRTNSVGFHGNGIIAVRELNRPFLIRLDAEGLWYSEELDEPRVGGRMAIGGQVRLLGRDVTVASVHIESHSNPTHRRDQTERLLDALDLYDPSAPTLIGGDFNTSTISLAEQAWDLETWNEKIRECPLRRLRVQAFEPLFQIFKDRGFTWETSNLLETPTERRSPPIDRPLGKVDWFFTRGLTARNPAVVPAVDGHGNIISDHDALYVEIG
jgi:endonuclease/exonuclease/phosphatase family metal-dependent hydrolase